MKSLIGDMHDFFIREAIWKYHKQYPEIFKQIHPFFFKNLRLFREIPLLISQQQNEVNEPRNI